MTAFCTLCGNMEPGDLGATIGICLNADACHRRQARMREHRQYVAEQIAREIEDIICTSEAACGDLDCRQALADAATARHIGGVREAAPPVAAALEDADALPGMPSPSPVPAVAPTAGTEPAEGSEAAFARQLLAQAKAADAEYKVAAVRAAVYTFLHQHGRSSLPTFKVAVDLAVSLRKIIDDLGDEEARDG